MTSWSHGFQFNFPMGEIDWASNTLARVLRNMGACDVTVITCRPPSRAPYVQLQAVWTMDPWTTFRTGDAQSNLMALVNPKLMENGSTVIDWVATWFSEVPSYEADSFTSPF